MSAATLDPLPLLDRVARLRDRLLASARFQRWAAAFPFTRRIAARHARSLFDICAGFVYSQILLACVRLKLFDLLAEGALDAATIARRVGLDDEAATRLLDAAIALQLLERRRSGQIGLGMLGAAFRGNPGLTAMVEHHSVLYGDLADPVALLKRGRGGTRLAAFWPYATSDGPDAVAAERIAAYSTLMSASQPLVADDILDAYPLARHRVLLDVGGGEGTFVRAAAARALHLQLIVFDLPPVAARAALRLREAGLADRARAVGGDFGRDRLPQGADLITLVRVAHDHDDERVIALFAAARRALPADGVLLIAEPMSGMPGAEPMGDAYFGFYLLAMGSGRPRTPARLESMLRQAGFSRVKTLRTRRPLLTSVIAARP